MSIQPISSTTVSFSGKEKYTDKGNSYKSSSTAKEPSERTKKIVSSFKTTVALIGAGITAATTLIGKFIDVDISSKRAKAADIANPIPHISPVRK